MDWVESLELINDIDEALVELGTRDGKHNIVWLKRERSNPDLSYLQEANRTPVYTEYEMGCLPMGQLTKEEILSEGLNDALYFKYYISGKQFNNYSTDALTLAPKNADRVRHRGIVYEVVKTKTVQVGENDVIHIVYATEASIVSQDELYREQKDPYFEYDASQEELSTNDTGVNTNMYIDYPAVAPMEIELPLVVWDSDNKFKYRVGTMPAPVEFIIPAGVYTADKFLTAFTPVGLEIVEKGGMYFLQTIDIGVSASLEIFPVEGNICGLIGVGVGIYKGREVLRT